MLTSRVPSVRGLPSLVQTAPLSSQARSDARATETAVAALGLTVISQRSLRPFTRRARVTDPPVTSNEWSPKAL